ncbi:MAG TPA: hypothetical protein VK986_26100 [Tepidisphaeraceae bacterium]|nr:hypothetical protein [Tepidisphaeraceae bacterium]
MNTSPTTRSGSRKSSLLASAFTLPLSLYLVATAVARGVSNERDFVGLIFGGLLGAIGVGFFLVAIGAMRESRSR